MSRKFVDRHIAVNTYGKAIVAPNGCNLETAILRNIPDETRSVRRFLNGMDGRMDVRCLFFDHTGIQTGAKHSVDQLK